jgi:hypothetical protein
MQAASLGKAVPVGTAVVVFAAQVVAVVPLYRVVLQLAVVHPHPATAPVALAVLVVLAVPAEGLGLVQPVVVAPRPDQPPKQALRYIHRCDKKLTGS